MNFIKLVQLLTRLEGKVDTLLNALKGNNNSNRVCSLCGKEYDRNVDVISGVIINTCSCDLPAGISMDMFKPTTPSAQPKVVIQDQGE